MFQVLPEVLCTGDSLSVGDPCCHFICLLDKLCPLLNIDQCLMFSGRRLDQLLPQLRYLVQPYLQLYVDTDSKKYTQTYTQLYIFPLRKGEGQSRFIPS